MEERKTMTKEERELLNSIAEGFLEELKKIENTIDDHPFIYKDEMNKTHTESHAKYNDYVSRAMVSDMFQFFVLLNLKNHDVAIKVLDWTKKMQDFNFDLMRMFDDDKGNRPMAIWDYDGTKEFATEIQDTVAEFGESVDSKGDRWMSRFLEKCEIWAKRLVYMDTWAYCLENSKDIEDTLRYSKFEEYDSDGNKIGGLKAAEMDAVKFSCRVRRELNKMLIHVDVESDEHDYLLDKLEKLKKICDDLMENHIM